MTTSEPSLGTVAPTALSGERLQLHYGAWILASLAHAGLPVKDDDSHTNLGWDAARGALTTRELDTAGGLRAALTFDDLTVRIVAGTAELAALPLPGRTFDEALKDCGKAALGRAIERREFPDFPSSPVGDGEPFASGNPAARSEIAAWFSHANTAWTGATKAFPGSAAPRIWPHHFDLGTLVDRAGDGDAPLSRGYGFGMSPGDHHHDEPYLYAYVFPTPGDASAFGTPSVGTVTTTGFTGPLLTAREALAFESGPGAAITRYVDEAVRACARALGA